MPKKHTITIDANADGYVLTMSDNGKTDTNKLDTVVWKIGPKANIERIVDIKYKDPTKNVFDPEPTEVPDSTDWKGTIIDAKITSPLVEEYYIQYRKVGIPGVFTYDPIIQVNPEPPLT